MEQNIKFSVVGQGNPKAGKASTPAGIWFGPQAYEIVVEFLAVIGRADKSGQSLAHFLPELATCRNRLLHAYLDGLMFDLDALCQDQPCDLCSKRWEEAGLG